MRLSLRRMYGIHSGVELLGSRECVLFIGTQFSNLYTSRSGYASQRPRGDS
jgi:hypothetical protein